MMKKLLLLSLALWFVPFSMLYAEDAVKEGSQVLWQEGTATIEQSIVSRNLFGIPPWVFAGTATLLLAVAGYIIVGNDKKISQSSSADEYEIIEGIIEGIDDDKLHD